MIGPLILSHRTFDCESQCLCLSKAVTMDGNGISWNLCSVKRTVCNKNRYSNYQWDCRWRDPFDSKDRFCFHPFAGTLPCFGNQVGGSSVGARDIRLFFFCSIQPVSWNIILCLLSILFINHK